MRVPRVGDRFVFDGGETYFVVKVDDRFRLWLHTNSRFVPDHRDMEHDWSPETWSDIMRGDDPRWVYTPKAPEHLLLPIGA